MTNEKSWTAWLIEGIPLDDGRPTYAKIEHEWVAWTTDPLKALHFARKEDADSFAYGEQCMAIREHRFGLVDTEIDELRAENARLRAEIGSPEPGSHPDEAKPRAETWHKERLNWINEVDRLRAKVAAGERLAEESAHLAELIESLLDRGAIPKNAAACGFDYAMQDVLSRARIVASNVAAYREGKDGTK